MTLRLRELTTGDHFRFEPDGPRYEYRGNGWYSGGGWDGGPWHESDQARTVVVELQDVFELRNDLPPHRPDRFENQFATRQRKLLDGLDCLPGQQDLF